MSSITAEFPSYLDQSDAVRERFARIRQRVDGEARAAHDAASRAGSEGGPQFIARMRYRGQGHELEVAFAPDGKTSTWETSYSEDGSTWKKFSEAKVRKVGELRSPTTAPLAPQPIL